MPMCNIQTDDLTKFLDLNLSLQYIQNWLTL